MGEKKTINDNDDENKSFRTQMKEYRSWKILLALLLLTVPFLGLTDFNTKGEPREAIVALSMLDSGNWILPMGDGDDMAYKPPFFHWCVAAVATLTGSLDEFASRLPSALSMIVMAWCMLQFAGRRQYRIYTPIIMASMFEVHRAAAACRVDLVLTACITVAICMLYRWMVRCRMRGIPYGAIIAMGLGTLTKGPVAIVLPCMVGWLFAVTSPYIRTVRQKALLSATTAYALVGIASLLLPLVWYALAYRQAGDAFLNLVMEENIGRFLGRMSYESHSNPFFMPPVFILAGMMPYTLLLLFLLPVVPWRRIGNGRELLLRMKKGFSTATPFMRLSIIAVVAITLFYCIPSSKRSVYLLPAYPFLAYLMSRLFLYCQQQHLKPLRAYGTTVSTLCVILSVAFIMLRLVEVPQSLFHGKHAAENIAFAEALHSGEVGIMGYAIVVGLPMLALVLGYVMKERVSRLQAMRPILWTLLLFLMLDSVIQPLVLNTKSDRQEAIAIEAALPEGETIYSYCGEPMMRFFAIDFYTHNRVKPIELCETEQQLKTQVCTVGAFPQKGYVLIADKDTTEFFSRHRDSHRFTAVYGSHKRGCDVKDFFKLYRME